MGTATWKNGNTLASSRHWKLYTGSSLPSIICSRLTQSFFLCSPHKGCNEPFDAKDVVPAPEGVSHDDALAQVSCYAKHVIEPCFLTLLQCPRCKRSLCKQCKVPWHESMFPLFRCPEHHHITYCAAELTCKEYQAIPINERAPEDLAFTELAKQERWRRCPKVSNFALFQCYH